METKLTVPDVPSDVEFNTIAFEKKLTALKDSQDSINSCCHWCLQNRHHHKKIVSSWLNVLKRVKIEHRLTLFYLANDVIQYSKRRNYDFVESWGTTLQKATTLVRDEKIKNKILRIFKIWEDRAIYGEEFITDLSGLISASPSVKKGDGTHQFQSNYLIQKIRACTNLENDTDAKLNDLKEHNPKIQIDSDLLISSLKDRAHVDDVEKELDDYTKQMENYINALKHEIKSRIQVISLLAQAETQIENDKRDVKLVTTAYRTFAVRVKNLKKKLEEKIPTLSSPIPSPDVNAPSPSSDSDIELPNNTTSISTPTVTTPTTSPVAAEMLFANPGYYNPVPPPDMDANFNNGNNFSSFIGSSMPFNLGNLNTSSLFTENKIESTVPQNSQTTASYSVNNSVSNIFPSLTCPPPPPSTTVCDSTPTPTYQYTGVHAPLLPPPMPPFSKAEDHYGNSTYSDSFSNSNATFSYDPSNTASYSTPMPDLGQPPPTTTFDSFSTSYTNSYQNSEPPLPTYPSLAEDNSVTLSSEYNPADELETWEPEPAWEPPTSLQDTPDSPPMSEKTGYTDPVEYHDEKVYDNASDIDHRILPTLMTDSVSKDGNGSLRKSDVDHRNLISLTSSPSDARSWPNKNDQDFRKPVQPTKTNVDQDYRVSFIESLKLPPPPPPPKALTNDSVDSQYIPVFNRNTNSFSTTSDTSYSCTGDAFASNHFTTQSNRSNSFASEMPPLRPIDQSQIKNKFYAHGRKIGFSPKKFHDNVESIDMDLSDDNEVDVNTAKDASFEDSFTAVPDLLDDVNANDFLDDVGENFDLEDLVEDGTESLDNPKEAENLAYPSPMFYIPPPSFKAAGPPPNIKNIPMQDPSLNWMLQEQTNRIGFNPESTARNDFGAFRGRAGIPRGNFNHANLRGNWNNNARGPMRGGAHFRGFIPRGNGNHRGRGFRGRGPGDGIRGRGDFRGLKLVLNAEQKAQKKQYTGCS